MFHNIGEISKHFLDVENSSLDNLKRLADKPPGCYNLEAIIRLKQKFKDRGRKWSLLTELNTTTTIKNQVPGTKAKSYIHLWSLNG